MECCQCQGIEQIFDDGTAEKELKDYRKNGAGKTTKILTDAIIAQGVANATLLDIGGGVGAIQHTLLHAGASTSTNLDASSAYIQIAKLAAEEQGLSDRITHHHDNFADMQTAPTAEIVTLEKVICCYHDMPALVDQASTKATRLLGVVYPRDVWWAKLIIRYGLNFFMWLSRNPFRTFIHPTVDVNNRIQSHGFQQVFHQNEGIWQVYVFKKQAA